MADYPAELIPSDMNKQIILDTIRSMAESSGGDAPGQIRFSNETDITQHDWQKYWARWGDALEDAGFAANSWQQSYADEFLIAKIIELTRELKRFPTKGDMLVKAHNNRGFPSYSPFKRLGSKAAIVARVLEYCQDRAGYADIVEICKAIKRTEIAETALRTIPDSFDLGFVYLLKSGRFYKIGRSNAFGRRERELSIQLPDKADTVHVIKTDDPIGIEAYWHKRFEAKRRNGEWFELSADEVKAFKRRKVFM